MPTGRSIIVAAGRDLHNVHLLSGDSILEGGWTLPFSNRVDCWLLLEYPGRGA
jgi:hypothetical protein